MQIRFEVVSRTQTMSDQHGLVFDDMADAVSCAAAIYADLLTEGHSPIKILLRDHAGRLVHTLSGRTIANSTGPQASRVA